MPVEARIRELDSRHHHLDEMIDQEVLYKGCPVCY